MLASSWISSSVDSRKMEIIRLVGRIASPGVSTLIPRTSSRMPSSRSVAINVQRSSPVTILRLRRIGLISRAETAALAS